MLFSGHSYPRGFGARAASLLLFFPFALAAQTPGITVNSATLTIDPQNSDSYTLAGTFSGIPIASAQTLTLAIGQFAGTIAITDLVQQPGTNVYVYQDATGLTPSWFSNLTLDLDAQTFSVQATGTVLAGLRNPFAVQFATDTTAACTMARVQATDPVTWQLTAGDGVQEPCAIPAPPFTTPTALIVNTATNVQIQVPIQATPNFDPTSVQLFKADANGQPMGTPLCTLQDAAGVGLYSCTATFNESVPGLIPLLIQANASPNVLLSPGFSLIVVQPMAQADIDALSSVTTTTSTTWDANYTAYGDSAQARVATLIALRQAAMPAVAKLGLLEDGLSIGILFTSGVPYTLLLNQLDDTQAAAQPAANVRVPAPEMRREKSRPFAIRSASPDTAKSTLAAAPPTLSCGSPQRPVAKNNQVIVWKSMFFPEPTLGTLLMDQFKAVVCPDFQVVPKDATIAEAMNFPQYGTIIIDSHSGVRDGDVEIATDDPVDFSNLKMDLLANGSLAFFGIPTANPSGRGLIYPTYYTLKSKFFASLGPFQSTITLAASCKSAYGGILANIFAANGGAFYGFTQSIKGTTTKNGVTIPGFVERIGPQLFTQLLNNYTDVTDAYQSVDHEPLPGEQLGDPGGGPIKGIFQVPDPWLPLAPSQPAAPVPTFVLQTAAPDLAYLGNPQISAPGYSQPYFLPAIGSLDLQAQLDGASSCQGIMNLNWSNTATSGHLTPDSGGSGQDNFTATGASATYTSLGLLSGSNGLPSDNITVNFVPDPANPPAAQACTTVTMVPDQILHVVFDGQGQSSSSGEFYQTSADITWHAEWDLHIPQFQDTQPTFVGDLLTYIKGVNPGTLTVTGTTSASEPMAGVDCTGPPVFGGITQAPYIGIGNQDPAVGIALPILPMFVEVMGGGLYHLCDGSQIVPPIGDQVAGYPGWDSNAGLYLFNLDVRQFLGKTGTATLPVSGGYQSGPDDLTDGMVSYTGQLTFSTTGPCNPLTGGCSPPASSIRRH